MKGHSNWSGRVPRTTEQAFGAHTSRLQTQRRGNEWPYWVAALACAAAFGVLLGV